ncbi:MAG: amidohydrolase family protein [Chlorobi bacterium]|nr:amidohydrolase family protein [Chlorobiota bacterium]
MKKWYILFGLFYLYTLLHVGLPEYMLAAYNRPVMRGPYPPPADPRVRALWDSLPFTADWHGDALLWGTSLNRTHKGGMVNIPWLRETKPHLQMFTIVTKVPHRLSYARNSSEGDKLTLPFILSGRDPRAWFSLKGRVLEQTRRLKGEVRRSRGFLRLITDRRELEAWRKDAEEGRQTAGALMGIEGLHCLEGDIRNLDLFFDEGIRMASPFHLFDNELGGSAHGLGHKGLTPFGKRVIRRMDSLGMIIDVAHASPRAIDDILAVTKGPLVCSHTGAQAVCPHLRNLEDRHIRAIAERDGLIGVGFFHPAVCRADYDEVARTIRHIAEVAGIDHVALGSDFDGAVTTPTDVRGLSLLAEALARHGFSDEEIRKIMYENTYRFLSQNLPE